MKILAATRGLTFRMLIIVVLLQVILFPVLFGGLLYVVKQGYETQFIDHARSDAYVLANSVSESMDFFILEDALITGRIVSATVYDNNGNRLYASMSHDAVDFAEEFEFGTHSDQRFNVTVPLSDKYGTPKGRLLLSYDEIPTQEQIDEAFNRGLMFAAVYVLVSVLLTTMLGRKLTRPIEDLRLLSRDVAHGQFHQEIQVNSGIVEVDDLTQSLEFMRSELVKQTETMEHQALHDGLTGLPNRALLHDRIDQALYHPHEAEDRIVLLLIDLDHFKEINDSFGHLAGDNVLMESAIRLKQVVRKCDTVCRLGGDEFAVLLPTADEDAGANVAEKLHAALSETINIDQYSLRIGASIGLVTYPEHGDDFETLLGNADIAMYAAKKSGGGVKVYNDEMNKDSFKKLTLASDLRVAVGTGQFFLMYQPKLDMLSSTINSAEALLRWSHPEKGLISPADFIPLAERTGLITSLTAEVIKQAVVQMSQWIKQGKKISVAVNLSAYDLETENLTGYIVDLLDEYSVPHECLQLEITESVIIKDPLQAFETLIQLHDVGIKIALDDFGTGYSSLSQLRKLPLSIIKIDRSFVFGMVESDSDTAIVKATISMAHELGLRVVAEGPEDERTLKVLAELACDEAQGFYISKPLISTEFESFIESYDICIGSIMSKA